MSAPIIFDWGFYGELALRLARELGECVYFSPWASSMPKPDGQLICQGLGDFGVKRIDFPLELVWTDEEPTAFIFPDLYFTDTQTLLNRLGMSVWGSGWGELLELDKWKLYRILDEADWPVSTIERIDGIQALERKLRMEYEEQFVKVAPVYRGIAETYRHRGWPASRAWFEKLRADLGPKGDSMVFMIQTPVPGDRVVEPGLDMIVIDGEIQFPTMLGYELKDSGLITQVIDQIPDVLAGPVQSVAKALGTGYRNFFSSELRVNEHGEAYYIDATTRMPRPGDGVFQELIGNLGAVMMRGEKPNPTAKFACQLMLESSGGETRPLHVEIPAAIRDNVKLYSFYRDEDGEYWTLPQGQSQFASVVAVGDDLEKVKKDCLKMADEVKADGLSFERDTFDLIEEEIDKGERNGIQW